ncbi:hypothetical protein EDD86DRAFT_68733 [Gorgonomyces haynaldii]|nr:hypothetical protein EDD86DRAFT_68733 [Gorgonomyces haynaldii]
MRLLRSLSLVPVWKEILKLSANTRFPLTSKEQHSVHVYAFGFQKIPAAGHLKSFLEQNGMSADSLSELSRLTEQLGNEDATHRSIVIRSLKELKEEPPTTGILEYIKATVPSICLYKVGCGDCLLLSLPVGKEKWALVQIDGGKSEKADQWWPAVYHNKGLDSLIVTHCDEDHIAGIMRLGYHFNQLKNQSTDINFGQLFMQATKDNLEQSNPTEPIDVAKSRGNPEFVNFLLKYDKFREIIQVKKQGDLAKLACDAQNVEIFFLNTNDGGHQHIMKILLKSGYCNPNMWSLALLVLWHPPAETAWDDHDKIVSIVLTGDAPLSKVLAGLDAVCNQHDHVKKVLKKDGDGKFHLTMLDMPHHGSDKDSKEDDIKKITAEYVTFQSDGGESHRTMRGQVFCQVRESMPSAKIYCSFESFIDPKDDAEQIFEGGLVTGTVHNIPCQQDYHLITLNTSQPGETRTE